MYLYRAINSRETRWNFCLVPLEMLKQLSVSSRKRFLHLIRALLASSPLIKQKVGEFWKEHDYVFCTPLGTHIHPGHDILEEFKKLLKKASLPDIRFHDLRHSAATMLLSMGIHPKVVQELLGHNQISMTMDT